MVVPDSRSCRYGSCTTRLGILINALSSVLSSASSQFSDPKLLRDAYVARSAGSSSVAYAFLFHVGACSLGPLTFDFAERSRDCRGSAATRSYCLADMTASNVVECAVKMGVDCPLWRCTRRVWRIVWHLHSISNHMTTWLLGQAYAAPRQMSWPTATEAQSDGWGGARSAYTASSSVSCIVWY